MEMEIMSAMNAFRRVILASSMLEERSLGTSLSSPDEYNNFILANEISRAVNFNSLNRVCNISIALYGIGPRDGECCEFKVVPLENTIG